MRTGNSRCLRRSHLSLSTNLSPGLALPDSQPIAQVRGELLCVASRAPSFLTSDMDNLYPCFEVVWTARVVCAATRSSVKF